jgi:hypothetical protein
MQGFSPKVAQRWLVTDQLTDLARYIVCNVIANSPGAPGSTSDDRE